MKVWKDQNKDKQQPTGFKGFEHIGRSVLDSRIFNHLNIINSGGGHGAWPSVSGLGTPNWNTELQQWEYPKPPKDSSLRKQYKEVVNKYEEVTKSGENKSSLKYEEDVNTDISVSGVLFLSMPSGSGDFINDFNYKKD